jgi:hypothetical protein
MSQRRHASPPQDPEEPNSLSLLFALHQLRDALRRINDRLQAHNTRPPEDTLLRDLADANRALAEAESHVPMMDRSQSSIDCLRCQGEGQITQRGIVLQRIACPDCRGQGRVVRSAPAAPQLPRGCLQRLVLTRLLALGGASWPVSLKRLWAGHSRSRADHAARSRTVRILEERGLVQRADEPTIFPASRVGRASYLVLTGCGVALAQRLTIASQTLT